MGERKITTTVTAAAGASASRPVAPGSIAAFFEEASGFLAEHAQPPEGVCELVSARARGRAQLDSLRDLYEDLCADAEIGACEPLKSDIQGRFAQVCMAMHRLELAHVRVVDAVQADCKAIVNAVVEVRNALRALAEGWPATQEHYASTAAAYRDAVALGTRIRAMLAPSDAHSAQDHVSFLVGVMLERAADAFAQFLHLHARANGKQLG